MSRSARLTLTMLLALISPAAAQTGSDSLIPVADLPLTTVPTPQGRLLAVLLTGDGGWAAGDRSLAAAFVRQDVAVVGLSSPKYLAHGRTPAEASADLARILRHFLAAWHRERVIVVGYSRGADIGPFMVSRLPSALRSRVALTVLLGPGPMASFRFALLDILSSHTKSGGLPVSPEVAKLRGIPVLCIYGARDPGAICASLQAKGLARAVVRSGGHAVGGAEGPALVSVMLGALPRSGEQRSPIALHVPAASSPRFPEPTGSGAPDAPRDETMPGQFRVLVVDDDSGIRSLVARVLERAGWLVVDAGDGAQALEILERGKVDIDLVLTDVSMPMLDGLELGRRIAGMTPPRPVLYMSSELPDALASGGADRKIPPFLLKPFSMETLVTAVVGLLAASAAAG